MTTLENDDHGNDITEDKDDAEDDPTDYDLLAKDEKLSELDEIQEETTSMEEKLEALLKDEKLCP